MLLINRVLFRIEYDDDYEDGDNKDDDHDDNGYHNDCAGGDVKVMNNRPSILLSNISPFSPLKYFNKFY